MLLYGLNGQDLALSHSFCHCIVPQCLVRIGLHGFLLTFIDTPLNKVAFAFDSIYWFILLPISYFVILICIKNNYMYYTLKGAIAKVSTPNLWNARIKIATEVLICSLCINVLDNYLNYENPFFPLENHLNDSHVSSDQCRRRTAYFLNGAYIVAYNLVCKMLL